MKPAAIPNDWLGYLAASLTTLSFVPQALLTLRTREVDGISAAMYSVFTLGVALWLAYGWRLGEWPIIIANAVTLVLAATILVTKLVVEWRPVKTRPSPLGRSRTGCLARGCGRSCPGLECAFEPIHRSLAHSQVLALPLAPGCCVVAVGQVHGRTPHASTLVQAVGPGLLTAAFSIASSSTRPQRGRRWGC